MSNMSSDQIGNVRGLREAIMTSSRDKKRAKLADHNAENTPRMTKCIEWIWKVLNNKAADSEEETLMFTWLPGYWEFLIKDEIIKSLQEGYHIPFPRAPPSDETALLGVIVAYFKEFSHEGIKASLATGVSVGPGIVFVVNGVLGRRMY